MCQAVSVACNTSGRWPVLREDAFWAFFLDHLDRWGRGEGVPDLAKLRKQHPHWRIEAVWACASSGPVKVLYLAPELVVRGSTAPYQPGGAQH